jgi:hypothetical protein
MTNKSKQAGTAWETTVKEYLQQVGLQPKRTGSDEMELGDIHAGVWTLECKAEARIDLPGYLAQLARAVMRRGTPPYHSSVWVKNRRHGVKDAYVIMSGENSRSLMVYIESMHTMLAEMAAAVAAYEQENKNG